VLTGTSSHYGILRRLESSGVSLDSVTIVNLPPAEGRAAFRSAQIDAWAIWPPFPEHEEIDGTAVELASSEATIQSLLVIDGDFMKANPAAAAAVDRAVNRAKQFIASNPTEAQDLVAKATSEPIAVVRAAWPKHDFGATLGASVRQDVDAKARFLFENKFLSRPVNPETMLFEKLTASQ
jgi:sulfonate transport system substrate-binding protein